LRASGNIKAALTGTFLIFMGGTVGFNGRSVGEQDCMPKAKAPTAMTVHLQRSWPVFIARPLFLGASLENISARNHSDIE
jgi:hypothetical protein